MKKILLLLVTVLISLGSFAQEHPKSLVEVMGEGKARVVPDEVIIRSRIEHTGQSAAAVKKLNDQVVAKVLAYLKEQGISSRDVQTDYIRLNKEYDYNTKEYHFSANQGITIHLKELENYEELMEGLLNSGLNRIDDVVFQSSELESLQADARKKAVLNAKMKAEEYAAALGQSIGKAYQISDVESNDHQPIYKVMRMESADSSGGETIAPGEMEISLRVKVSFELK